MIRELVSPILLTCFEDCREMLFGRRMHLSLDQLFLAAYDEAMGTSSP